MANLTEASRQWRDRPDDERFTSLLTLREKVAEDRRLSEAAVASTRDVEVRPADSDGLRVLSPRLSTVLVKPTHWSFGQLAGLAGAPAGYLRTLPPEMAADCLNFGLRFGRDAEDVGLLARGDELAAATGPRYGRVWNSDVADALVRRFGDGATGHFRVPGVFGKPLAEVTREATTLYASDRDMWVFLADEGRRVEVPARPGERSRSLARGFFVWNSEVGAATLGVRTFLFDYVCQNRIVWGAEDERVYRVRHTASAPHKWVEEVAPALAAYAEGSARGVEEAVEAARNARLALPDGDRARALEEFLAARFTRAQARAMAEVHLREEGRPVETRWDVAVAASAVARAIPHADARVELEAKAGEFLSS